MQRGTLRGGDNFICGMFSGRVRALFDERGKTVKEAGPSIPVQILGFEGVPTAGDIFAVVTDAVEAREIAQKRQRLEREAQNRRTAKGTSLEDFSRALKEGEVSTLRIIIKADQGGPAEALADALAQLSTSEVRVDVVHRGVGAITESDILLAKASGAIVLGFHVRPDTNARAAAEREQVDVRTYRIIYEAVEDVRTALEGLLKPEERETVLGEAEVLQLFKVSKVGTIAGCTVRSGTIQRTAKARVIRDGAAGVHRHAVEPQALQGRRARSARGLRVRHRHRELQRPQGRRPDRVVPDGRGQADAGASGRSAGRTAARQALSAGLQHDRRHRHLGPPPPQLPLPQGEAGRAQAAHHGAAADPQRLGGGDRPAGSLAAGRDRLRRGGQRLGRSWRRFSGPRIGWSRRPTACASWTR